MLRTRQKLFNVIESRSKFVCLRKASSNGAQWKEAKPFNQIPGPSVLGLVTGFLPGGKYQKLNIIQLSKVLQQEFGDLTKFPGIFGQKNMIFTFDPNDIETVFRTEGKHPTRTGLDTLEYFRGVYRKEWFAKGTGLVPSNGQDWYDFRTKVNQTMLQPKTAKLYIPQVEEVVSELVTKIKKNRDANGEVPENFLDYLNEWALESIGLITLDTRLGVMANPETSEVNKILKDVARLSFEYDIQPGIWRMYKTKGFQNVMNTYAKLTGIMKEYADESMRRLESAIPSVEHEAGVLEKLMKIDKHVAFVMVLDSLLAGVDTTTSGLVATLYMLAKNPDKQENLRKEVLSILPEKSSKLTPQSLNNIPYLRAVIKEALRLNSPINGNIRSTGTDLVLKGYQVPKDTVMVLATNVLSVQDKHFDRSNEFIPERWLKENTDPKCPHATDSHPFAYLPFGFGPRMCVGRRFAELEIEVLTMRMIREFKLEWHHPDLTFKSYTFNLPGDPLRFKVIDTAN